MENKTFAIIEKYQCNRCGKYFKTEQNLDRHINNKKNICGQYTKLENGHFKCSYCNTKVKTQSGIRKHLKQKHKETKKSNNNETLVEKVINLENMIGDLLNIIKTNNIQINNTPTIVNNNNNSVKYEIKIYAFGQEDLSHITESKMYDILACGYDSITKLTEAIHFSEEKPENCNIRIEDVDSGKIKVYNGETWEDKEKDSVITNMVKRSINILNKEINHHRKSLMTNKKRSIFNFLGAIGAIGSELQKQMTDEQKERVFNTIKNKS